MTRPLLVETCPECQVKFSIAAIRINGHGTPKKLCPNGHWTKTTTLVASRCPEDQVSRIEEPSILRQARSVGILGQVESLQMGLLAMLGCYEQVIRTLPPTSQAAAIVIGAFGHCPEVARKIIKETQR